MRGEPAADRDALARLMVALSRFAADHADQIAEIDLNPVIVSPSGIVAVDAKIRLAPTTGDEDPGVRRLASRLNELMPVKLRFRSRAEVAVFFDGLHLVEPGLVRCADWWPDGPRVKPLNPVQYCIVGAVGRKP